MRQTCRILFRLLPVAILAVTIVPADADGQRVGIPRWSVVFETGTQFPAYIYDDFIEASIYQGHDDQGDPIYESFRTRYQEYMGNTNVYRLTMRHRPAGALSVYVAAQLVDGLSRSTYVGGDAGPDTIPRSLRITSVEAGAAFQLTSFANGMGVLEYTLAPALFHHKLDLSAGHRDRFARWGGVQQTEFDWTERTWVAWGFSTGASLRVPITSSLALRGSANFQVVPVPTAQLERQEQDEVWRLVSRKPIFNFGSHSAQYPTVRFGVDYVVNWQQPPAPFDAPSVPVAERRGMVSPETARAQEMALAGDTAQALEVLRGHLEEDEEDPSAWRLLALILAERAEEDPEVREEALSALQRALRLMPGEEDLLRRFGRVRSLALAGPETRPEQPTAPLAIANPQIRAAEGMVGLPFTIENLSPRARYRIQVEIVDSDGVPVPLRRADMPDSEPADRLRILREPPDEIPVRERVELEMLRYDAGTYSIMLDVTDLATRESVSLAARFVLN